jgi:hypothetical protein
MIAAMNWGRRITKAQKGIFPEAKKRQCFRHI